MAEAKSWFSKHKEEEIEMKEEEQPGYTGYCVKCGKSVSIKDAKTKESDGVRSVSGTCPTCGTKVYAHSKAEMRAMWEASWGDSSFPDSSFMWVPESAKGADGNKSDRKLPVKTPDGKWDMPHVRNALARLNQTQGIPSDKKKAIQTKLQNVLKKNSSDYEPTKEEDETQHYPSELIKRDDVEIPKGPIPYGDGVQTRLMSWDEYMEHVKKEHAEAFKKLTETLPQSVRISPQIPEMYKPNQNYSPQAVLTVTAALEEIQFAGEHLLELYRCPYCEKEVHFEASVELQAGLVAGNLLNFDEPNKNNWMLSKEDADDYVEQFSTGNIALTDTHGRSIRDYIGRVQEVKKIVTANGNVKLKIKAKITDPEIDKIVQENPSGIGFSIEGESHDIHCSVCNAKLLSAKDFCEKHPMSPIMVRHLQVRKVSLTDNPAYKSVIESYETD